MNKLSLRVYRMEAVLFEGECQEALFPSVDGQIGVMAGHTRLVTPLRRGQIQIHNDEQSTAIDVDGGVLVVTKQGASVLLA